MWAFDLEKRQHLFAHGVIKPLAPNETGFYGSGPFNDQGVNIQKAEDEIDAKFSLKQHAADAVEAVERKEGAIKQDVHDFAGDLGHSAQKGEKSLHLGLGAPL